MRNRNIENVCFKKLTCIKFKNIHDYKVREVENWMKEIIHVFLVFA